MSKCPKDKVEVVTGGSSGIGFRRPSTSDMKRAILRPSLLIAAVLAALGAIATPAFSESEAGEAGKTVKADDIAAREAYILGKPPRIAPLKPDELDPEVLKTVNTMLAAKNLPPLKLENMPEAMATMWKAPELIEAWRGLATFLFHGMLPGRDRELVILRTAWLCRAPFVWSDHVPDGKRTGMTEKEIVGIKQGSTAAVWGEHDRAVLRAVEELFSDAMITDETWAVLARTYNEKQLIELPILVGQYQGVTYMQNSLRLRLMPGEKGLATQ